MKSLFQSIRSGDITKQACISQLNKYQGDKIVLTRVYLAKQIGLELYTQRLESLKFSIDLLQMIVDKFDDFRLPLKNELKTINEGIEDEN